MPFEQPQLGHHARGLTLAEDADRLALANVHLVPCSVEAVLFPLDLVSEAAPGSS